MQCKTFRNDHFNFFLNIKNVFCGSLKIDTEIVFGLSMKRLVFGFKLTYLVAETEIRQLGEIRKKNVVRRIKE